ncbi:MAG: hypothetical protein R3C30_04630 [Hyphomonadaceae bacterium]
MQVTKLRGTANANGLVPAGQFFAQLAAKLEEANFEAALREAELEEEDRALEATYRKRSAARGAYAEHEQYAMM